MVRQQGKKAKKKASPPADGRAGAKRARTSEGEEFDGRLLDPTIITTPAPALSPRRPLVPRPTPQGGSLLLSSDGKRPVSPQMSHVLRNMSVKNPIYGPLSKLHAHRIFTIPVGHIAKVVNWPPQYFKQLDINGASACRFRVEFSRAVQRAVIDDVESKSPALLELDDLAPSLRAMTKLVWDSMAKGSNTDVEGNTIDDKRPRLVGKSLQHVARHWQGKPELGGFGELGHVHRVQWVEGKYITSVANTTSDDKIDESTKKTALCVVQGSLLPTSAVATDNGEDEKARLEVVKLLQGCSAASQRKFVETIAQAMSDQMNDTGGGGGGTGLANVSGVLKGMGRWLTAGGGTAAPCNECGLVECQCNVGHVCVNCQDAGLDECDCRLVQVAIPHGVVRYVEAFVVRVVAEMNSTRPAGWKHGDDHAGRKIVVMRRMSAQQESYTSRAKAAVSGMGAPRAHASPWRSAYPRSKQFLSTVPVNAGDLKTYRVCVTAFISDLVRATIVDRPESVDDMEILVSQIFFGDSVNEAQNITDVMQTGANSIVDNLRELTGQTVRGKAGDLTEVERILILQRLHAALESGDLPGVQQTASHRGKTGRPVMIDGIVHVIPRKVSRFVPICRPEQPAIRMSSSDLNYLPMGIRPTIKSAAEAAAEAAAVAVDAAVAQLSGLPDQSRTTIDRLSRQLRAESGDLQRCLEKIVLRTVTNLLPAVVEKHAVPALKTAEALLGCLDAATDDAKNLLNEAVMRLKDAKSLCDAVVQLPAAADSLRAAQKAADQASRPFLASWSKQTLAAISAESSDSGTEATKTAAQHAYAVAAAIGPAPRPTTYGELSAAVRKVADRKNSNTAFAVVELFGAPPEPDLECSSVVSSQKALIAVGIGLDLELGRRAS